MHTHSWMAITITAIAFTSCQKNMVNTPSLSTSANTTNGILGPIAPSYILLWSHPTDMPMPSDYYIGWDQGQAFAINGKGYTFCGRLDSRQATTTYPTSLWEYDPATGVWTARAPFPGGGNIMGCHFVIGSKVYIVLENKCWAWDQTTNIWTVKASIPSHTRLNASAFAIKGKGYVGLGSDDQATSYTLMRDWWEYDPAANTWTQKKNFAGPAREYAPAFAIGDYGYICSGNKAASRLDQGNDLWQYNPARDSWTRKTAPPAAVDLTGGAIGLNGAIDGTALGFVVQGIPNGCLDYNPATDAWGTLPDVPGARYSAAGFMIDKSLYVIGGTGTTTFDFRKDVEVLHWYTFN
ncbi:MAG TPA: hypothetical protein VHD83_26500 [Puia sp.]|nr:hypothetical protein [Puia sp.]